MERMLIPEYKQSWIFLRLILIKCTIVCYSCSLYAVLTQEGAWVVNGNVIYYKTVQGWSPGC